jgi:DNA repair exonuclease SbcCD ATPase subunit/DNA repair exonuclease SbcCD nuclease subunit
MIVEKIYHLADLHIRNLKRHKEYRSVFEKFLENVKNDNIENSVIYLAGDIAHAKTEMSPELVREISWFLTECAKLKHTFLITGNHDCNLNNDYRLDVLTPIVENLNNDRIHYLRDTGTYNFGNLTFVVYSILDKKENWPKAELVEGENKICLFHGPVNKAQTDVGYTVSSNSFTVDMFDGFDMVMLGDIHKRQTFGENYEHIAYAGSMIQQNHGELLENHGYLLWDVKSRTFEEFHIHNDYGYLTIDVVDGEIPQWVYDEIDTKLPKYPRLRLRFTRTEPSDTKRCVTELKKLFKVSEVTVTRTDTIGQLKTNQNVNQNIVGNVKDETFQNQLIRDYLERQFLLDGDELDKIGEINKEINSQVDDTKVAENVLWVPKTFEFSNMFSYGEGNKIRFDNAQGIMGIFAPNASGKSSLFDALSFCIFDKTSRTFLAKNILNNRKDWFQCKFHFQINDVDYYIERKAKKINKGKSVKVDVNFWSESGGVVTSLNGEQRRDTNTIINQYLGSYDDFVLTALSLQGNNALFIDKSQSERKEILSQFIGVDIFDKLYQRASEEFKDTTTLIKKFKRDDFTSKLADIDTNLISKKNEYKILTATNEGLKQEEEKLNKQIISLNEKIVKLGVDSNESIDDLKQTLEKLTKSRTDVIKSKESIQERINEKEELQIRLEEEIDEYDEDNITKRYEQYTNQVEDLKQLNIELDKMKIREESLKERIEHVKSHEYNPECEICLKNSEEYIDAKMSLQSELSILVEQMAELITSKESIESSLQINSDVNQQFTNLNKLKVEEDKIDREISGLINKLSTTETQEARLDAQVTEQEKIIEEYIKNEQTIEKNREIRSEISNVRELLTKVKGDLKITNTNVLKLNGEVSSLQNQKETIEERIKEVKELEEQHGLFQYYLNALGKDGVSYELISKALPMIEGEVNNILTQIVEFGMQLEMDGKNINAYIVYDDQKWSLEMCSGMERFISGLAIRIALINVCNLPRPNFLVIDEGFGTLDNENLTSLYMLFTYLKTQFDFVMIISHIDSMRDVVDSLMEIKKVNGFSSIKL